MHAVSPWCSRLHAGMINEVPSLLGTRHSYARSSSNRNGLNNTTTTLLEFNCITPNDLQCRVLRVVKVV
jgi:hypothetical protein